MATRRLLPSLVLAVALTGTSVGCGSADTPRQPAREAGASSAAGACPRAPRRLVATLHHGLRGTRLGRVFAVRSNSSFAGKAPAVRAGLYFVAADLGVGAAVGSWAV